MLSAIRRSVFLLAGVLVAVPLAFHATAGAQPRAATEATGDASRGQTLYETTLRCYACHGFDGQTGTRRLVPMRRSQDNFIAYLREPSTPGMPRFVKEATEDLEDIYAYIQSLPTDSPPVDSIPLLRGILERATQP